MVEGGREGGREGYNHTQHERFVSCLTWCMCDVCVGVYMCMVGVAIYVGVYVCMVRYVVYVCMVCGVYVRICCAFTMATVVININVLLWSYPV